MIEKTSWSWTVILLIIVTESWAQRIDWSESYDMSSVYNTNEIIHADAKDVFVLHTYKDKNYYIRKKIAAYTTEWTQSNRKEGMGLEKGVRCQKVFANNQQLYMGYTKVEKGTNMEQFFVAPLNANTLTANLENAVELFKLSYKDKQYDAEGYGYTVSPNGQQHLFYGKMPYDKKAKAQIGFLVVNSDLKKKQTGMATLTQVAEKVSVNDVTDAVVDDLGNAYLLCKLYRSKDKKEERKIGMRYVYTIMKMDKDAKVQVLDTLDILNPEDSAMVVSAKLSLNTTMNQVYCVGTYKRPQHRAALFSYRLDDGLRKKGQSMEYATSLLDAMHISEKERQKKKRLGIEKYKIKQILEQEDGTQLVLLEQHYIKVFMDKSEGRQEIHQLNNILALKINDSQEIEWATLIPKRQKGGGVGFSGIEKGYSFFGYLNGEVLNILYNETAENLEQEEETKLSFIDYNLRNKANLIHKQIDLNTGNIIKEQTLVNAAKEAVMIHPTASIVLPDGSVLLSGTLPEKNFKDKAKFRMGRWYANETK